jgi:hypothetical protein
MGGDHPHVDAPRHVASQSLELALLQHPQQLHLDVGRHVPDLVQEHRPRIGLLELARLGRRGPGERPFLLSEKFALYQVLRQGGAVDLHQRPVAARRVEMDGARNRNALFRPVPRWRPSVPSPWLTPNRR